MFLLNYFIKILKYCQPHSEAIAYNVLGIRRFFVPDKEKCVAFLRAQKNVAEQNPIKGVPALSARPTGGLCSPNCPIRAICVYRLLCDVNIAFIHNFYLFT